MFTGIVQSVGEVISAGSCLRVRGILPYPIPVGGSVAVNGCCLTHLGGEDAYVFDLSGETLERTTLGSLAVGSRVNLEAALRAGDPLGGHFVQGHIDSVGTFLGVESGYHRFRVEEETYLVDKGSIAIDGVSLTVVHPIGGEFAVALIPHTLASTTLGELQSGASVNIEFDILAKYVMRGRA